MNTISELFQRLASWRTSSVGGISVLLGLFGNVSTDDLQTYIDWFNNVMSQDNKAMRFGLILSGLGWLLMRDKPNTPPSGPPPANSSDKLGSTTARTSEASDVSATSMGKVGTNPTFANTPTPVEV